MSTRLSVEQIRAIPDLLRGNEAEGRAPMTIKEIGVKYGVSHRTIDYWIKRLKDEGVEVPTFKGKRPLKIISEDE
jgi:transposase